MPMLFIKCPATGKPVPTGFAASTGTNLSGFKNNSVQCIHCGKIYTWDGKDAFFQTDFTLN
jgi:hypothetical protein